MNVDLFLEQTFWEACQSQATPRNETINHDKPELGKYDRLADKRGSQDR